MAYHLLYSGDRSSYSDGGLTDHRTRSPRLDGACPSARRTELQQVHQGVNQLHGHLDEG